LALFFNSAFLAVDFFFVAICIKVLM